MGKPIVGVVAKIRPNFEKDYWQHFVENDQIRYAVVTHGGIAMGILTSEHTQSFSWTDEGDTTILTKEEIEDLHTQIDKCDGLILQGGLFSCSYEVEAARYAISKDMPVMGFCAGFNNILRALGSNVVLDKKYGMEGKHDIYDNGYRHHISVIKGSKLYDLVGSEDYQVNSFHTMLAPKENVSCVASISATSDDGLVECFEAPNKKFVMGIKWHPEIMLEEKFTDRLFSEFINKCKEGK